MVNISVCIRISVVNIFVFMRLSVVNISVFTWLSVVNISIFIRLSVVNICVKIRWWLISHNYNPWKQWNKSAVWTKIMWMIFFSYWVYLRDKKEKNISILLPTLTFLDVLTLSCDANYVTQICGIGSLSSTNIKHSKQKNRYLNTSLITRMWKATYRA